MPSRVYETVERPSIRPSICLFHRLTAAAAGGKFAAEPPAGRKYRSTTAGARAHSKGAAAWHSAANAGSVTLTVEVRG